MLDLAAQRILVTGGAGFLGRHLCELLRERGCRNLFTPRSADYDLVDRAAVRRMLAAFSPTLVIHLAARVGGIGANRDNPGRFFHDNLAMGLNLIDEARLAGVGKFVQLGTVCAYPKLTTAPFRETALWDGFPEETNAPYGIAKKALLVMLQAYRAQYGFNGIYLLPVNLYGPGDNFDPASSHVIPALIRKFAAGGDTVEIWGDGTPTREFLYVRDCAQGIIAACERYDNAAPVNLGSGDEISIKELALKIRGLTGSNAELNFDPGKPNGQPRRQLDTSRAELAFNWHATTPLDLGLKTTIAWWQAQQAEHRR
ncbi:MAG: GDP-L-fucose synthase [Planctomycetes bacterium]|nr:GDP-L-fucose synthase [Planctomycetota bacterium]MCW8136265.1 GDP-L-fucose synthase [Planctomycetota bacterium]